jgi:general secretion pathway protein M
MIKRLRPFLAKLSNREKMAIGIGIGFVGIFILVQVIVFPFIDARERLQRKLVSHTRSYDEIKQLRLKYLELQNRADNSKTQIDRRQRGFTLFSFLDKLAGEVGIKERITYMKPSSTKQKDTPYSLSLVEMKLNGITMEQITRFLYRIETSPNVIHVQRLSLNKKEEKEGLLNVILQVETFEI